MRRLVPTWAATHVIPGQAGIHAGSERCVDPGFRRDDVLADDGLANDVFADEGLQ